MRRLQAFLIALSATSVAACADPPGTPHPLPFNYQEESSSLAIYDKYAPLIRQINGVDTVYLSANNNPRLLVVVVRDTVAQNQAKIRYGQVLDGKLNVDYRIEPRDDDGEGPIAQVPTAKAPGSWWEVVTSFFTSLPAHVMGIRRP